MKVQAFLPSLVITILAGHAFGQPVLAVQEKGEAAQPVNLIQKAYSQLRGKDYAQATKTLCASIRTEGDSQAARRYLSYALLQQGLAEDALKQMASLPNTAAFDLFMKGVAFEMTSEPGTALDWFRAAVEKEPENSYFRNKTIDAMVGMSKYDDAIALCADGSKLATDANAKSFYAEKLKKIKAQSEWVSQAVRATARVKSARATAMR